MIKTLCLIGVVVLCSYIGFGCSRYFTSRKTFFKNIELLFSRLKTAISFSQNKLVEVLSATPAGCPTSNRLVKNFVSCLNFDKPITPETLFDGIHILSPEEKNVLEGFFKTLGKFDASNQTTQLEMQKAEIAALYTRAETSAQKYSGLSIKLGIIVGLVIAVVLA